MTRDDDRQGLTLGDVVLLSYFAYLVAFGALWLLS